MAEQVRINADSLRLLLSAGRVMYQTAQATGTISARERELVLELGEATRDAEQALATAETPPVFSIAPAWDSCEWCF